MIKGNRISDNKKILLCEFAAALLGGLFFIALYGVNILDPTYDGWLYSYSDITQHYVGWRMYRSSDWMIPIGKSNRILYPDGVSVIYTDSIPIVAVFFKCIRSILTETFQYFGLFGFVSYMLQGAFGCRLVQRMTKNPRYGLLASILFITEPAFVDRMFRHTALAAHWILLWGFCIGWDILSEEKLRRRTIAEILFCGWIASGIHIYLLVMSGIMIACSMLIRLLEHRSVREVLSVIGSGIAYLVICYLQLLALGAFGVGRSSYQASGLTQASFNLNGFFNPMGWSRFLEDLSSYGTMSSEGFAYLGLGVLLLSAFLVIFGIACGARKALLRKKAGEKAKGNRTRRDLIIWLVLSCGICFVISLSPTIAVNGEIQFAISVPQVIWDLWSIFRSSGRFVWVLMYGWTAVSVSLLYRMIMNRGTVALSAEEKSDERPRRRPLIALIALAAVVGLNVVDTSVQWPSIHQKFATKVSAPTYDFYRVLNTINDASQYKHFYFTSNRTGNLDLIYGISCYALDHNMTMNIYYVAHDVGLSYLLDRIPEDMENLEDDTIYIFKLDDQELMEQYNLVYYEFEYGYFGVTGNE